jgi:uncharacterized protein (TIGR02594 family)
MPGARGARGNFLPSINVLAQSLAFRPGSAPPRKRHGSRVHFGDAGVAREKKDRFGAVSVKGDLAPEVPEGMPWLAEAAHLYDNDGEIGIGDGRRIVRLVNWVDERTSLNLPWCGLFVGHCIRKAFPSARLPWFFVRARPWRSFGNAEEPQVGAIMLFWLRWRGGPFGHVGFYWGEDDDSYHLLGGNQHRTILVERFPKHRLIDCRWPPGIAAPGIRRWHPPGEAEPFEYAEVG